MSLRSLGYLLTRRFYPSKICGQGSAEFLPGIVSQAASVPAAGGPGRSLHSLRGLRDGENAYGPLVASALVGGLGILIFKKHRGDADNNVTDKNTNTTEDLGTKKPEVTDNKPITKMEKRDVDMEARFHKWMKRVGRVYPSHEEEKRRFELFKERVKVVESLHVSSFEYLPNKFADKSDNEIILMTGRSHGLDSVEYEREALIRITQAKMLEEETSTAAQKQ